MEIRTPGNADAAITPTGFGAWAIGTGLPPATSGEARGARLSCEQAGEFGIAGKV